MLPLCAILILQLCNFTYGAEAEREHRENLFIVNKELAPDGFQRSTVVAGNTPSTATFPGPLIAGKKGERFMLNVTDQLTDASMVRSTSVHWHGLFQSTTNYADGVAFVSQCPIAANHSFLYDFQVPDQAGTYWWHSHMSVQYADGLRGPLVIYDDQDPYRHMYDFDDGKSNSCFLRQVLLTLFVASTVITIADWFHATSLELLAANRAPPADATLINGKGRYNGGPATPLEVFEVQHGKRYRYRLVSISFDASHSFSIDGHDLTIIEVDGVNTEPHAVNFIQIYPGQRYSFVLFANQKVDNYRIRALASSGVGAQGYQNGLNSAILRYKGARHEDPTSLQSHDVVALREADLHPRENPGAPGKPYPGGADVVLNMTLGFTGAIGVNRAFTINGEQYKPPRVPVLLQILSGKHSAHDLLPNGSVYTLPRNKVIEVNFFGGGAPGGPHPFHLHGHAFDVVRSSDSPDYNFKNPVRRDVTLVSLNNQTTIRFETDNAGPWFLHCHIDLHLELGLAVVMAEDTRDTKLDDPVTPEWQALCPVYDSLTPAQLP